MALQASAEINDLVEKTERAVSLAAGGTLGDHLRDKYGIGGKNGKDGVIERKT